MINFERNVTCDRCHTIYKKNNCLSFVGRKNIEGRVTGLRAVGNLTYNLPRLDLCDDCLRSFVDWLGVVPAGAEEVDGEDDAE